MPGYTIHLHVSLRLMCANKSNNCAFAQVVSCTILGSIIYRITFYIGSSQCFVKTKLPIECSTVQEYAVLFCPSRIKFENSCEY